MNLIERIQQSFRKSNKPQIPQTMNIRSFTLVLLAIFAFVSSASTASACSKCHKPRRPAPRAESGDLPSAKQYVRITIKGIDGKYRTGIRQVSSREEAIKLARERGATKEGRGHYDAYQAQRGR